MKVALIHDWLVNYGGAERVVEDILSIFPETTLFTLVYDKKKMPKRFENYNIVTTYMQKWPLSTKLYKNFLTAMPRAFESLDLSAYDLVISSCTSCSKGVITKPTTPHICYCNTPTRYIWDMYYEYLAHANPLKRLLMPRMVHSMRIWDKVAADRVDYFISNSNFIKQRIKKYYHRDATTIYPGVNINNEEICASPEDYYLVVSRFVHYKRIDIAIEACTRLGKQLIVVGIGDEDKKLRKLAGPTIEFKGNLSDTDVRKLYSKAKAFLFPGEEDFGLTPVEAQVAGTPVLAFGRGGALETVIDGKTGLFFLEQNVESLVSCIEQFEDAGVSFSRQQIHEHGLQFSRAVFCDKFKNFVEKCYNEWKGFD